MNIISQFSEWSANIKKEYIDKDGTINSKRLVKTAFGKLFPVAYEIIKTDYPDKFREVVYCILNDISEFPKCPICGKELPLRNFKIGFQKTCSRECGNVNFHSEETVKKMTKTVRQKNFYKCKKRFFWLQDIDLKYDDTDGNWVILKNYCKHGDIRIYQSRLTNVYKNILSDGTLCPDCNKEIFNSYIPTQDEYDNFVKTFPEFYNANLYRLDKEFWMLYYPKKLKLLKIFYEKHFGNFDIADNNCYAEAYYAIINHIVTRPKCKCEGCSNDAIFFNGQSGYSIFCKEHSVGYNCSGIEYEVKDFIDSLGISYIHNDRNLIGKELDFYFPDKNLAIEVNGCWYHSDKFKSKNYHRNKFQKCLDNGVELIYIWEDDWKYSKSIIQNYLKAKLGIFDRQIYARNTELREVSISDSRKFLDENHLQGYCNAKFRYGLYYYDELVQMMTFGYSRFKKGEIELLRFCTKGEVKIIGGASKLFTAFIRQNPDITDIISYANCDISKGDIYERLGFKYIHTTDNWSWLYNGMRINRFNKIRKKADELGLYKCYSAGTMKFLFTR